MKKLLFVFTTLVALIFVVAEPALSQRTYGTAYRDWGTFSLGVGAEFVLPVSEGFKDFYNVGFGGTLRGEYAITPDLSAMLTAGYVVLTAKEIAGVTPDNGTMIPVTAGIKYYFFPGDLRWYAGFDLGITSFKQNVTVPILGTVASETTTEFTWQPQLGMAAKFADKAAFDISARWIGISDANSVGVRFGVMFLF